MKSVAAKSDITRAGRREAQPAGRLRDPQELQAACLRGAVALRPGQLPVHVAVLPPAALRLSHATGKSAGSDEAVANRTRDGFWVGESRTRPFRDARRFPSPGW